MMNEQEVMAQTGDALSLSVLFGYYVSALPTIALTVTIIWTLMRIGSSLAIWWQNRKRDGTG